MRIAELRLDLLEVPFRRSLATATGDWTSVRLGLLRLRTDSGLEGLGELAPDERSWPGGPSAPRATELEARLAALLPGLDVADEAALGAALERVRHAWTGQGRHETSLGRAIRSAIATAAADILAQARGRSLAAWLVDRPPATPTADGAPAGMPAGTALRFLQDPPSETVVVNALLGIADAEAVAGEARRLVDVGFRCLKLKGGVEPRGQVTRRVAAVRDAVGPTVALRLDLNGSLDEPSALELLPELAAYGLEYVEQPIPESAGAEALARLRRQVGVPIAADEAVTDLAAVERLARAGAVDAVVVKPGRVGGLPVAARIAELALASDTRVTVSTLLESGVGVAAALHLAASVPGEAAHGLSTSGLLATDLLREPLTLRGGRLAVPQGAGLGVAVDGGSVARYRVPEASAHA